MTFDNDVAVYITQYYYVFVIHDSQTHKTHNGRSKSMHNEEFFFHVVASSKTLQLTFTHYRRHTPHHNNNNNNNNNKNNNKKVHSSVSLKNTRQYRIA